MPSASMSGPASQGNQNGAEARVKRARSNRQGASGASGQGPRGKWRYRSIGRGKLIHMHKEKITLARRDAIVRMHDGR